MSVRAAARSTLSNGNTIIGTGGSPGPNTSNALNLGATGNNMGAPQAGAGATAPASYGNAVDNQRRTLPSKILATRRGCLQKVAAVPPSPPHIPQASERAVLQKLGLTRGLPLEKLYPAGKLLISRMVAKGWIQKQLDGRTYLRTAAGNETLRAIIPVMR